MTRISRLPGYVVLAIFVAMTTAAHLETLHHHNHHSNGDIANVGPLVDGYHGEMEAAARGSRQHERSSSADAYRKRQSFSVTQDLDALAEMLREAARRRQLKNAIAFFNALKRKRRDADGGQGVIPAREEPIENEE